MPDPTAVSPENLLARGVGRFAGEESMPPAPWAPDGMQSQGSIEASAVFDGQGLVSRYQQRVGGQVVQSSVTVIRWNATAGVFTMHFFGGASAAPVGFTGTADGARVRFIQDGEQPAMRQDFTYHEHGFEVRAEMYQPDDGTWAEAFRGSYQRQAPS